MTGTSDAFAHRSRHGVSDSQGEDTQRGIISRCGHSIGDSGCRAVDVRGLRTELIRAVLIEH